MLNRLIRNGNNRPQVKSGLPFGKYDWIEGFDHGLCRVKIGKQSSALANNDSKWLIINKKGEDVLPCVYDEVWMF